MHETRFAPLLINRKRHPMFYYSIELLLISHLTDISQQNAQLQKKNEDLHDETRRLQRKLKGKHLKPLNGLTYPTHPPPPTSQQKNIKINK